METEILDKYKKAGQIAAEALQYGKSLIKKGASVLDVTQKITAKIEELGGKLAFPVNISLNDTAAHYSAKINDELKLNDEIIKLDVGAHVDGYIGDTACTIDLSGKNADLVKASEDALQAAIKIIKPGVTLGQIGKAIEDTITKAGFKPVRNLSGHGLGEYRSHAEPQIPNFDTGDDTKLEKGQIIAIEPFATNGIGLIQDKGVAEIFSMMGFKSVRVTFVRNVMKYIGDTFLTLPFSKLQLSKKFSEGQISFALKQFSQLGIMHEYKPLVEARNGLVSQAEHTIYVDDTPIILTKLEKTN
ncbi:MAG: type II methionyl aminopeptidase [Nanoarchaeota archaeon]|nr:type II methionyl aminopeptidase [Nanoarchaeota archaeon]